MLIHVNSTSEPEKSPGSFLTSRSGLVFIGFAIIAGILLFTEHRAHALGVLIWLPLLACPLMHLFMHHGHSDHGGHSQQSNEGKSP
ncbi:MAG: DUF2933 domain-containing protein [Xanthobacteraceae bacterium]|nr:DUF2933 domain-containing protein [Xanthobacteraceae bacterium]